jgi:TolB-like protein
VAKRIELLRHALGDSVEQPRYIELVRSFGYRLAAPITVEGRSPPPDASMEPAPDARYGSLRGWLLSLAVAAVLGYLLWDGFAPQSDSEPSAGDSSLAVLPFQAMGDDPGDRWFAEGLTEELTHALAESGDLQVTGRTSVREALARNEAASGVGASLGVAYLLEGSVSREEGRLRVRVRLVSAADGLQRWSETFDMPEDNAFALQQRIAEAVERRFSSGGSRPPSPWQPLVSTDPETYALYLKAVSLAPYPVGTDLAEAQRFVENAVTRDPEFAPAWSLLATVHLRRLFFDATYPVPPIEAIATIRGAVDRALAIDPTNANAYATLAGLVWAYERDMQRAAELLEQAIQLAPNSLDQWMFARDFAGAIGDLELARELGERIVKRDPLCISCRSHLARIMVCLGDLEAAEGQLGILVGDARESPWYFELGKLYLDRREIESAEQAFARVPDKFQRTGGAFLVKHVRGDWTAESQQELEAWMGEAWTLVGDQPTVATRLGQHELAMQKLLSLTRTHYPLVQGEICSPDYEPLRNHPRWPELMETLDFHPDGNRATDFELPFMPDS